MGKNDLILEFLTGLSKDFLTYNENVKKGILSQAEARLAHVSSKLSENIIGISHQEAIEIEGENHTCTEYEYDEKFESDYNNAQSKINEIKKFNKELDTKLIKLRNIIRIYLKLEWNKAKKGN